MRQSLQYLQDRFAACYQSREHLPSFLDFEASSLSHRSYPIEVAFSLDNGWVESHLIKPQPLAGWDDWSDEAETVHGISRDLLAFGGHSPRWVAERLNHALEGRVVYCDGGEYDFFWLSRLYQAAGLKPSFTLAECADLFEHYLAPGILDALVRRTRSAMCRRHRAALDVGYLQSLWQLVLEEYTRLSGGLQPQPLCS